MEKNKIVAAEIVTGVSEVIMQGWIFDAFFSIAV